MATQLRPYTLSYRPKNRVAVHSVFVRDRSSYTPAKDADLGLIVPIQRTGQLFVLIERHQHSHAFLGIHHAAKLFARALLCDCARHIDETGHRRLLESIKRLKTVERRT